MPPVLLNACKHTPYVPRIEGLCNIYCITYLSHLTHSRKMLTQFSSESYQNLPFTHTQTHTPSSRLRTPFHLTRTVHATIQPRIPRPIHHTHRISPSPQLWIKKAHPNQNRQKNPHTTKNAPSPPPTKLCLPPTLPPPPPPPSPPHHPHTTHPTIPNVPYNPQPHLRPRPHNTLHSPHLPPLPLDLLHHTLHKRR